MLRELVHFAYHAPATMMLKSRLSQTEMYDTILDRANAAGLAARRIEIVADLTGEILEIGCGTGMMFPHYQTTARVHAIEIDPDFLSIAQRNARNAPGSIEAIAGDANALPFADDSFDAVVFGLVLCSVPSVRAVLSEVRRVLRPGGRLTLIEHIRSEGRVAGPLMSWFNPVWLKLNGQGCNMDRNPIADIESAGFTVARTEPFQVWAPGIPAFPMVTIFAHG